MGVSFDTPADNKKFKDKFDFPYDLLSDESKATSGAYGVPERDNGLPTRVSVLVGADGNVLASYSEVVPAEHPDQVLADLKKLT